jgi:hypothetical protein
MHYLIFCRGPNGTYTVKYGANAQNWLHRKISRGVLTKALKDEVDESSAKRHVRECRIFGSNRCVIDDS